MCSKPGMQYCDLIDFHGVYGVRVASGCSTARSGPGSLSKTYVYGKLRVAQESSCRHCGWSFWKECDL